MHQYVGQQEPGEADLKQEEATAQLCLTQKVIVPNACTSSCELDELPGDVCWSHSADLNALN